MKKPVPRRTREELRNFPITNIVNGWFFRIDEISQGYYRVEGVDQWGHSISRDGIDPDQLLGACRADILEMFPDL
jgi:hypothetical protein